MLRNAYICSPPHFADVHLMSFRISAYAQYQVTPNHQKKSANVSMASRRGISLALRAYGGQVQNAARFVNGNGISLTRIAGTLERREAIAGGSPQSTVLDLSPYPWDCVALVRLRRTPSSSAMSPVGYSSAVLSSSRLRFADLFNN
jgi:hypothetical protein